LVWCCNIVDVVTTNVCCFRYDAFFFISFLFCILFFYFSLFMCNFIILESYGSHGNQCLSPLKLWVRISIRRGVLDTTLCDRVCQWLATGRWFSPGTLVSSTNKTDRHVITEILSKVALNTITLTLYWCCLYISL